MRQRTPAQTGVSPNHPLAPVLIWPLVVAAGMAAPVMLIRFGLLVRPDAGLVREGNGLYAAVSIAAILLVLFQGLFRYLKKPLPGLLTRQGLVIALIGLSGLLILACFAPRFPESARTVYLVSVGIVIGFAAIPIGLMTYLRSRFSGLDDPGIKR